MSEFKIIPGLESYEDGIVKALPKIREGNLSCLNNMSTRLDKSKRHYKEKIIKPSFKQRYWYVCLMHNGIKRDYRLHRLVYKTFIGDIPKGMVIDHIDGNTSNNNISNLRCVTASENCQNPNTICKKYKSVLMYDKDGNFLKEFKSQLEAMVYLGYEYIPCLASHIGSVCNGKKEKKLLMDINGNGRKSLADISWKTTGEIYRQDPALSYSTLARYEREGFNNLDKLFDRVESPSLVFGSAVDTLITGSEKEFNEHFMVAQLDNPPSDTLVTITKKLFNRWSNKFTNINDISDNDIVETIQDISWNNHWLPKTRAKKIKEDCAAYYKLLYLSEGKTILSTYAYQDIMNTVDKLKSADSTRFYFEQDNAFDDSIERLYQLKFKANIGGIDYRCMADLLLVFHDKKLVVPVDLKTSHKPEWDFYKSFIEWRYDIQARLYWRIIRDNMDKDPYFKDFKLADYRFIVANKRTLTPLVWIFEKTQALSEIVTKDGIVLRPPHQIGEELFGYIKSKPAVPNGINLIKPNRIDDWL